MFKIILLISANDREFRSDKLTRIGRRVLWPMVPRKGETVWVSEGTDCSYQVDRVEHVLVRNGYSELHFKSPASEMEALMEQEEGWRDMDAPVTSEEHREHADYFHWLDDL